MTVLKRPVRRESAVGGVYSQGKMRPVIISLEPGNLVGFRLKGERKTYYLTSDVCYWQAMKAHLAHEKREKAKAKRNHK